MICPRHGTEMYELFGTLFCPARDGLWRCAYTQPAERIWRERGTGCSQHG